MVEVRVGDEFTADGFTATVIAVAPNGAVLLEVTHGQGVAWVDGGPMLIRRDDGKMVPMQFTWALPRVGDEWLWSKDADAYRIVRIHGGSVWFERHVSCGKQVVDAVPTDTLCQGWRPAPRSPKAETTPGPLAVLGDHRLIVAPPNDYPTLKIVDRLVGPPVEPGACPTGPLTRTKPTGSVQVGNERLAFVPSASFAKKAPPVHANPAPQVGDVWTYEGWTGAKRVERVDGDAVFFDGARDGSHGPWAHSELSSPNWHRVSAAPAKPARQCRYRDCDPRPLEDVALKPPPTWRDLFHEVAANPPRYGRETWGKRAVKALWVRAAANALENVRRSYAKQVAGNGARQHVERDVDAEYRRLGGEVW